MSRTPQTTPQASAGKLSHHLAVNRYGDFELSPAIRPSPELNIVPRQGYRIETYTDKASGKKIPMLAASVSQELLFDVFMELLDELGDTIDVVIESHHERSGPDDHAEHKLREYIDMPVLQSYFHEFKDVLVEDGCLSVAVIDPQAPCEIQFDDHKLLVVYAKDLDPFAKVLDRYLIPRDDELKLISEAAHLHSTCTEFADQFESLCFSVSAE